MAWTVTVPTLEVAVTGTLALLFRVMAAARFEATMVVVAGAVLVQNEKFVPVFTPSVPPARFVPVQVKPLLVAESEKVAPLPPAPGVRSVMVTVLPLGLALTLAAAGHRLIAAARFEAKVDVTLLVA